MDLGDCRDDGPFCTLAIIRVAALDYRERLTGLVGDRAPDEEQRLRRADQEPCEVCVGEPDMWEVLRRSSTSLLSMSDTSSISAS